MRYLATRAGQVICPAQRGDRYLYRNGQITRSQGAALTP